MIFASIISFFLLTVNVSELSEWTVEGIRVPIQKLVVSQEKKNTKPKCSESPSCIEETFKATTDLGLFKLKYSRYSDQQTLCRHISHCGIAIPGLGNYTYHDNTIRVLVDGQDIMNKYPADAIDIQEGFGIARVRFLWKIQQADVAVYVAIVNGRSEGFVEIVVKPRRKLNNIEVNLICYPGGYEYFYEKLPPLEVRTEKDQVVVGSSEKDGRLLLSPGCKWIWYGEPSDKNRGVYNYGSVSLILLPEEGVRGEVNIAHYGILTKLQCSTVQNRIRFAITGYPGPNLCVLQALKQRHKAVIDILRSLVFWTEDTDAL